MAIMVQYKDKSFDYVQNSTLDTLIDAHRIIAFRRSSGWVEIGVDALRGARAAKDYDGPERRVVETKKSCLTCIDFVDTFCRTTLCSARTSLQGKAH